MRMWHGKKKVCSYRKFLLFCGWFGLRVENEIFTNCEKLYEMETQTSHSNRWIWCEWTVNTETLHFMKLLRWNGNYENDDDDNDEFWKRLEFAAIFSFFLWFVKNACKWHFSNDYFSILTF